VAFVGAEKFSENYTTLGGRRLVGTIWSVGAGDQSSRPVRNANSGNPLKFI